MKLTDKYCLCDMCSKLVEHLEENEMAKFLYFSSENFLIQFLIQYKRFEKELLYYENFKVSYLFEILKRTKEKYLCNECVEIFNKNCFPIRFPIRLYDSFPDKRLRLFNLNPTIETIKYNNDLIETLGFESNGRIEFAEAKNKKLAEIYFTPINVQIENSKVGNGEE